MTTEQKLDQELDIIEDTISTQLPPQKGPQTMTPEQKLDQELDLIEDTLASIRKMLETPLEGDPYEQEQASPAH